MSYWFFTLDSVDISVDTASPWQDSDPFFRARFWILVLILPLFTYTTPPT